FYLRKEEVFDFIQGTSVNRDLRELIALRQKEFANFALVETAERIRTYGIVYHANDFASSPVATVDGGELTGMGCCAGVVKAKVRVVRDPREATHLGGDILVTSSTDPGWVTLFPSAAGILVERGSLLSHSAIVSREMGKPCIVGITGLLQRLRTGDVVQMDGSTGVVKIIEPADAAA
ncbi:MAG TPA: PEP-utilizing enzyme, partial [Chitinophagales bacterium]|nr:PEP-utilizing enzyme [Chitinophagales bacterium]